MTIIVVLAKIYTPTSSSTLNTFLWNQSNLTTVSPTYPDNSNGRPGQLPCFPCLLNLWYQCSTDSSWDPCCCQFLRLVYVYKLLCLSLQMVSCEKHKAQQHWIRQASSSDWAFNSSPWHSWVTYGNIPDLWPCKPPQLFKDSLEDLCFVRRKLCHHFSQDLLYWAQGTGSAKGDPCKQTNENLF